MSASVNTSTNELLVPASAAQQRLWFLDRVNPGDASYNMTQAWRLRGAVDEAALCKAVLAIVARHSVLRTTFQVDDHVLLQNIRDEADIALQTVDRPISGEEDEQAVIQQLIDTELNTAFDLETGPLFRANLCRLGSADYLLLISQHHIIFDRTSVGLLIGELNSFYAACRGGGDTAQAAVPDLPIQYHDYAQWRVDSTASAAYEKSLAFWQKQLADFSPPDLPTDEPRSKSVTTRGEQLFCALPADAVDSIKQLAKEQGVTVFMAMLAAFNLFLQQWTGSRDISVGTPFADRRLHGSKELLGFFVNNIVLRTEFADADNFLELLKKVRKVSFDAYRHSAVSFEKVVEVVRPSRQENRNPLFDVHFAYQKLHFHSLALDEVEIEELTPVRSTSQYDVMLTMREQPGGYDARVEYRTDLFEAETIHRFMRRFGALLQQIAADPARSFSEYDLVTREEHDEIVESWNSTDVDYENSESILTFIEAQARNKPDQVILEFDNAEMTYAELDRRSNQVANFLRKNGVGPEVLVGACVERSFEMIVGLLGILKAGGAYVPLDPDYPLERLGFMVEDAQAPVILTQEALLDRLPPAEAKVICLDRDWDQLAAESEQQPTVEIGPDTLAYMIFTSGSTGRPKGAMNEHSGICNRLLWMQEAFQLTGDDVVLQKTPFSFDVSVWELFLPLMTGTRMLIPKPGGHYDPAYLAALIKERQVTFLHFVPSMLQVFLDQDDLRSHCQSLRAVVCSGEALTYDLQERFFSAVDAELHNLYGPTEAAVDVTHWQCQPSSEERSVPIGRPIANTQIHILDPELRPVPAGAEGELHIGGIQVGRGYKNRDELTAERFIPDPFSDVPGARLYKTGDLARWRLDGAIEYRGRIDFQVKVRGLRIELGEIEYAILETGLVQQVVVIVREDQKNDMRIAAYFVPETGREVDNKELRAILHDSLPAYMIPQYFVTMDALPLTSSGKVDRKLLPAPDLTAVGGSDRFVAPRTEAEKVIAEVWQELLGLERVGIHDNFVEMGGHSLLALQAIAEIQDKLDVDVPAMSMIMDTLEQIAAPFAGEAELPDEAAAEVPEVTTSEPLFFGPDDTLLGMYHKPLEDIGRDSCVLLCGPIYIESITSLWALRRLADQLSRIGYHVLRFDYFGSGDSRGASEEGNVSRWLRDIEAGAARIAELSGVSNVSLVGLRFGGSLAAMSEIANLKHLVLWDPIVDGREYLAYMRGRHATMIDFCNAQRPKHVDEIEHELLGFSCPPDSSRMIEDTQILDSFSDQADTINLVVTEERDDYVQLTDAMRAQVKEVALHTVDDVTCDINSQARLNAFMPNAALRKIISIFSGQ